MSKLIDHFNRLIPLNRKERFYTGTVLPGIVCCNNFKHIDLFFKLIPNFNRCPQIQADASENNIIFQTEYSFKESLVEPYLKELFPEQNETKDTPDIVILITEPELVLFVGEAKMFSNITPGEINTQMKNQEWFIRMMQKGLSIREENCHHFALVPQKLIPGKQTLNYPVVFWEEIIGTYRNLLPEDYFLNVLQIAIDKFDDLRSNRSGSAISFGQNADYHLAGSEIVKLHNCGQRFWVGRFGGRFGERFKTDLATQGWQRFEYEINQSSTTAPNTNWFSSAEFVNAVGEHAFEDSQSPETDSDGGNRSELGDWHYAHLGRDYFLEISQKIGGRGRWDAPISLVYVGKSGEAYIEKKHGRNVNPNWSVLLENGQSIRCKAATGIIENGSWNRSNCHVFRWSEIKKYFAGQLTINS